MTPEAELILRASQLSQSSPNSWELFVEALEKASREAATNCVNSPLVDLPRNQGRAQAYAHLSGLLQTCRTRAEKLERTK